MKKRVVLLSTVFIIILVAFIGCNSTPKKLTIGLVPSNNPQKMVNDFKPISKYLEKEMGMEVETIVPEDYLGLIEGMKDKSIDIGWYGAFSYAIAGREIELEPMVIQYRKGFGTSYHSLIIVRSDSNINGIEDLENKSFTFVDPGSTSGFVIPSALFKSRHIDIDQFFNEVRYSGEHDSVPLDVLEKVADAGAMEDLTFDRMVNEGVINSDDFIIIWKSDKIPGSPFIARSDLDDSIKKDFKKAMLTIHINNPNAVKSFDKRIERYVEFDDSIYNGIRNIARILGDDFVMENFLKK